MLIIGTSLAVPPFCDIILKAKRNCPKVLINLENTRKTSEYDFNDQYTHPERLFLKGKCDEVI